jgi:hypothetical protein
VVRVGLVVLTAVALAMAIWTVDTRAPLGWSVIGVAGLLFVNTVVFLLAGNSRTVLRLYAPVAITLAVGIGAWLLVRLRA